MKFKEAILRDLTFLDLSNYQFLIQSNKYKNLALNLILFRSSKYVQNNYNNTNILYIISNKWVNQRLFFSIIIT